MLIGSAWVIGIGVAGCCLLGATWLVIQWRRRRQRILSLDWPEKFETWHKLKRYCWFFLSHNGWSVAQAGAPEAEILVRNPTHALAVQFLIEKHYYKNVPDHFLATLAAGALKRKRAVALITDFRLADEIVDRCRRRRVYPIYYKDLKSLTELTPTRRKLLEL